KLNELSLCIYSTILYLSSPSDILILTIIQGYRLNRSYDRLISQQSHSNKVLIRIDGIETFLDHPNHDFLISSMRKVSQKPEKINTVEELCGCNFPFSQLSYPSH
ncbi:hypothetical protein V8G54_036196, partial [Vigna mungo]